MASRKVYWQCTQATYDEYVLLCNRYSQLFGDEDCEEAYVIRDELRSLPDWPADLDPEHDILVPVLLNTPTSVIHLS